MTADAFRTLALSLTGVRESAHGNHPDFRASGRVFASLGYPTEEYGMVKLTPDQQMAFMEKTPSVFSPCRGAWGLKGATAVDLAHATPRILLPALQAAWLNATAPVKKRQPAP